MKALVLFLIISIFSSAEEITFKELTKLASEDLGKNIYLDKDIPNYRVNFNLVDYQNEGEIYEFYKIVLFDHEMYLKYNFKGKFYFIKRKEKVIEPQILPELPQLPASRQLHQYIYKIKNITNTDVVDVFKVFPNVRYIYLKQSDIIVYSSTQIQHISIDKILCNADNSSLNKTIKITLFTTNKTKLLNYGSNIRVFNLGFDSKLDGILSAFKKGNSQKFIINDSASLAFSLFALQGRGVADIEQEPTMLLTNGVSSSVNYVKNIAYRVSSVTRDKNTETTTDQLNYRDVGFRLTVFPKIKDNWVYLDLDLTSEQLLTQDDNQIPVTQKISYKNSVKVYKGKPILLTGLKKISNKIEYSGIPFLKDLPYIGSLFRAKKVNDEQQNINILIEVL